MISLDPYRGASALPEPLPAHIAVVLQNAGGAFSQVRSLQTHQEQIILSTDTGFFRINERGTLYQLNTPNLPPPSPDTFAFDGKTIALQQAQNLVLFSDGASPKVLANWGNTTALAIDDTFVYRVVSPQDHPATDPAWEVQKIHRTTAEITVLSSHIGPLQLGNLVLSTRELFWTVELRGKLLAARLDTRQLAQSTFELTDGLHHESSTIKSSQTALRRPWWDIGIGDESGHWARPIGQAIIWGNPRYLGKLYRWMPGEVRGQLLTKSDTLFDVTSDEKYIYTVHREKMGRVLRVARIEPITLKTEDLVVLQGDDLPIQSEAITGWAGMAVTRDQLVIAHRGAVHLIRKTNPGG